MMDSKEGVFIVKAETKYGDLYDYSKVDYKDSHNKVIIVCRKHGDFYQSPTNHLQGQGCPICGREKSNKTRSIGFYNFCNKANKIHDYKYDYSKVDYINNHIAVNINCPLHGQFMQTPKVHLVTKGCPSCAIQRIKHKLSKNTTIFISQATIIHNHLYDYSKVDYINANTKVLIKCNSHGIFSQQPIKHLCGQGCPKCSHIISQVEIDWLDSLNILRKYRHVYLNVNGRKYIADAYIPEINTIYEFYGDYWHGNPTIFSSNEVNMVNKKTFGKLYQDTIDREKRLLDAGYKIVSIWENDFLSMKGLK